MTKQSVAVIGASSDRSKYSNKAIRAYAAKGWEVFPINPKGGTIEGLPAYASLAAVTKPVDRVTLYLPPKLGMGVLPDVAAARPAEFFVNPGAESEELVAQAKKLGLEPILACSIIELGVSPASYPD